jgi:enediyne biosynthesis protein E4
LKYAEFANKSIRELFPAEVLRNAQVRTFNYMSSCVAINEGHGNFKIKKLPEMVQLSSVNAALATDVNEDGNPDLILAGNQFDFLPQFSRLDASFGHLLINNGKGRFTWTAPAVSGLDIRNQVRDIIEVPGKKTRMILMLLNDDYPVLYNLNPKKQLR